MSQTEPNQFLLYLRTGEQKCAAALRGQSKKKMREPDLLAQNPWCNTVIHTVVLGGSSATTGAWSLKDHGVPIQELAPDRKYCNSWKLDPTLEYRKRVRKKK